jgi:cytochrome c-type biogenesis protein CcmH/NrfG
MDSSSREEALAMMRKALRLDPKGEHARGLEAEIAYLDGELSIERGAPDRTAFERALLLDPADERARKGLASLDDQAVERQSHTHRYASAAGIGVLAILATLLLMRRRAPSKMEPPPDAPPSSV